jgi:hypothetical protein
MASEAVARRRSMRNKFPFRNIWNSEEPKLIWRRTALDRLGRGNLACYARKNPTD